MQDVPGADLGRDLLQDLEVQDETLGLAGSGSAGPRFPRERRCCSAARVCLFTFFFASLQLKVKTRLKGC